MAWEKEGTEAAWFVKIDLLGNRSLTVIRDAVAGISEQISNNEGYDDIQERLSRAGLACRNKAVPAPPRKSDVERK